MAMERGTPTGKLFYFGDPEPLGGERLRSAVAEWQRGDDGLWRVVNLTTSTHHAYTWEQLSRCFRTLHEVTKP